MKQRVALEQLSVGAPLQWDVYNGQGTLLLRRGQTIGSERALYRLVEEGLFLDAEESTYFDASAMEEKPSALQHLVDAQRVLTGLYGQRLDDIVDFPARIDKVIHAVVSACDTHARVSLSSILLVHDASYTVKHPIDVAILSKVLAEALSLDAESQRAIVAAALTMNISMIEIQEKIHQIQGPLNEKLMAMITTHPQASAQRLGKMGIADEKWLTVVRQHHEHHDGSGYPAGLSGDQIEMGARIIGLADKYCALVCRRGYRSPQRPTMAIRELYLNHGHSIDTNVAGSLIRVLGLYPVGTLVRLVSSEIGVVTGPGKGPDTPDVHAIIGRSGTVLDIATHRKTHLSKFAIEDVITIDKLSCPVRMASVWGKDAKVVG